MTNSNSIFLIIAIKPSLTGKLTQQGTNHHRD